MIHHEALDQLCHSDDKRLCPSDIQNRLDNCLIVSFLVRELRLFRDELFDHIGIILRQCLSDLGSCVLGRHYPAKLDETVKRHPIPVLHILPGLTKLL